MFDQADSLRSDLDRLRMGAIASSLESETLDFKREAAEEGETVRIVTEAAICFANTSGGTIVLGVDDKLGGAEAFIGANIDRRVLQRRVYELTTPPLTVDVQAIEVTKKRLVVVRVPESPEIHADNKGRATHRIDTSCKPLSPQGLAQLRERRRIIDWSSQASGRDTSDVSPSALEAARALLARLPDARSAYGALSTEDLMRTLGVLDGQHRLLKAGDLLFCDQLEVAVVYQYKDTPGGEPTVIERLDGPLLTVFNRLLDFVRVRTSSTPLTMPNGQQLQLRDFPDLAVRESIANALIHRDYHLHGPITVEHSPSVLSVSSPGPLVGGVTPENILTHPSSPRNRSLAKAFRTLGLAEEAGRGVDRMYREMIRSGRSVPEIETTSERVRVSLVGGAPNTQVARFIAQLPDPEQEDVDTLLVVLYLCGKKTLEAKNLAPILQKSEDEAEGVLRRLSSTESAILEPTRASAQWRHPAYRFREDALSQLGTAVTYNRRTRDEIERKVIGHVEEYDRITNKTVRRLLDVDVHRAKTIIKDLVDRDFLQRTSEASRGPSVEYGPGSAFPKRRSRRSGNRQ
jgi:ATP-dependent DNA helicase RecG